MRDIYAEFGVVVHKAQNIEKMMLLLSIDAPKLTLSRLNEIIFEKSFLTFGLLKRDIESTKIFSKDELEDIDNFNSVRNEIIHNFWWNRTSKLKNEDSRLNILSELSEIRIAFEKLEKSFFEKQKGILVGWGMNPGELNGELVDEYDVLPSADMFRRLSKSETIIDVFRYKTSFNGTIPLFLLEDDTYWSVCEAGLTRYEEEIDNSKLEKIKLFKDIFPIKGFNPRPRRDKDWHYDLLLKKKNIRISIRPIYDGNVYSFEWIINQNHSSP